VDGDDRILVLVQRRRTFSSSGETLGRALDCADEVEENTARSERIRTGMVPDQTGSVRCETDGRMGASAFGDPCGDYGLRAGPRRVSDLRMSGDRD
jgi:hypothetical protein